MATIREIRESGYQGLAEGVKEPNGRLTTRRGRIRLRRTVELGRGSLGGKHDMRTAILLALMMFSFVSFASAQERLSEEELIQAFLSCPEIVEAQEQFETGADAGSPKVLLYNSLCGAVGCQYTALVTQKYERRKVNPSTRHILGLVHVGTKGNIVKVERVELVPFGEIEHGKKDL